MADKNNAVCSICGRGYHMCLACKDKMELAPWKLHTDTSEHYKIYQIIRGVSTGIYTNEEAKEKLLKVDLSDLESFREHIKNRIKTILETNKNIDIESSVNTDINTNVSSNSEIDNNVVEKSHKRNKSSRNRSTIPV